MTLRFAIPAMLVALLFALPNAVGQTTIYSTDFDNPPYNLGLLVGQDGWVQQGSNTGSPIQVIAGGGGGQEVQLFHGDSNEDANRNTGQTMVAGQTWTYAFDVIVDSYAGDDLYFAHFTDGGFGFNGRLHIVDAVAGGDFTFGISDMEGDGDATAVFATDGTFGTSYRLNVAYNFDVGTSQLFAAGFGTVTSTDADPMQAMQTFAFRQSSAGASNSTSMRIDNLTVTSIPEPTSMGLIGLVAVLGVVRRRK